MMQEAPPPWPTPRSLRAIIKRVRDAIRGYTDADMVSYDEKIKILGGGRPAEFTQAETAAADARRKRWGRS